MSSLSRGTWIEIICNIQHNLMVPSSLSRGTWIEIVKFSSLSLRTLSSLSRGTWIEITCHIMGRSSQKVVPLTRDVD